MKNQKKHSESTTAQRGNLPRICALVLPLCFFSVILAAAVVSVGNDMYAFAKPDTQSEISFSANDSLWQKAQKLSDADIINNPFIFTLYVKSKQAEKRVEAFSGTLTLKSEMSYLEILKSFK